MENTWQKTIQEIRFCRMKVKRGAEKNRYRIQDTGCRITDTGLTITKWLTPIATEHP